MNYDNITSFVWCVVGVFAAVIVLVFLFNIFESVIAAKIEEIKQRKMRVEAMDKIVDVITGQIKESMESHDDKDEK